MTVLVLAQEADAPTDAVVRELARRNVPVLRADLGWFPTRLILDAEVSASGWWTGELRTPVRSVALEQIRSIWYRDPSSFVFPDSMTEVERAYAHRESRLGVGGVLASLPVRWLNHPNRAADVIYKPLQLSVAASCGLLVQPTLVTNSPDAVRRFAAANAAVGVVCKSFGPNTITEGGAFKVAFTRLLDRPELDDLNPASVAATQVQRWAEKDHEARVVVVGDQMFTIAIHAHSQAARMDWRADFDALSYEWVDTPSAVQEGLRRYLDKLGLGYAAVDFVVGLDGGFTFLESNVRHEALSIRMEVQDLRRYPVTVGCLKLEAA